jgi:hypothetical protein
MSQYGEFETNMRDEKHLCAALKDLGFDHVEVHQEPQQLVGYHGDLREQVAHVIIRRQYVGGASNDIGFVKDEHGVFRAIVSNFDRMQHGESWLNRVKQGYAEHKTIAQAKQKGYVFAGRETVQTKTGQQVRLSFTAR